MMMGSAAPQDWSDRLAIIGAALKDASPGSNGNLAEARNFIMQRNAQRAQMGMIGSMFGSLSGDGQASSAPSAAGTLPMPGVTTQGPGVDGDPVSGGAATPPVTASPTAPVNGLPSITDPRVARFAMMAPMLGINPAPYIEVLKANQAHITATRGGQLYNDLTGRSAGALPNNEFINGSRVNSNDPNAPRFVGAPPVAGATPLYDAAGNTVDYRLPAGAAAAIDRSKAVEAKIAAANNAVAARNASTNAGGLGLSQVNSGNFAPPPGFIIGHPKAAKQ